jgi:hypothetical protein
MSRLAHFASVAVLAASLAPYAAQARSEGHVSNAPAEVLVAISGAQPSALHGRAAESAPATAAYSLLVNGPEYAGSDADGSFAG